MQSLAGLRTLLCVTSRSLTLEDSALKLVQGVCGGHPLCSSGKGRHFGCLGQGISKIGDAGHLWDGPQVAISVSSEFVLNME